MKQNERNSGDTASEVRGGFLRRADVWLILGLLLVGGILFLVFRLSAPLGASVTVRIENDVVARYPLNVDGTYSLNGGTNVLVVKDGRAHMEHADCPDGLCIRQGEISKEGERIVCLPNRVMITVDN